MFYCHPAVWKEIAAFVNDPSPATVKKRVDRMVSKQQYGERWGRHWLDLVRYAEPADGALPASGIR